MGPNAILQLLPLLDRLGGPERREQMLAAAGIFELPDGQSMIPEGDAARLHRQLRLDEPELAPRLSAAAGVATANYIMAHRIPKPAQAVLKGLLPALAARALSKAIARHAWTFAGSGAFAVVDPWHFEIVDNPLIRGERSEVCLCDWHAAVFERLYRVLVSRTARCREIQCGALGDGVCRFEVTR
ncbi:bacteriochlorophyll 4-vinyl reductase [Gymnodinialimonas ulvae]|uniref:bacteriochlorophyll 4-vinyl reductase n=1 Tax=Gymnodinialimonas ulvae TaxID=3126504 RepID=UPI003F706375